MRHLKSAPFPWIENQFFPSSNLFLDESSVHLTNTLFSLSHYFFGWATVWASAVTLHSFCTMPETYQETLLCWTKKRKVIESRKSVRQGNLVIDFTPDSWKFPPSSFCRVFHSRLQPIIILFDSICRLQVFVRFIRYLRFTVITVIYFLPETYLILNFAMEKS